MKSIINNTNNIPNINKSLSVIPIKLKTAPPIVSVYFLNGTLYASDSTTYDSSSNLFGYYGPQYNCSDLNNNCSYFSLQITSDGKLQVTSNNIMSNNIMSNITSNNNKSINTIFDPNIASIAVVPTAVLPGNNTIMHNNGLNQGEYIVSSDKRFKITLTTDGVLKYVYYIKSDICRQQKNGRYTGNMVDNISGAAIYNIPDLSFEPDMCNNYAGYVSGSGQLRPYTKESYAYGDNYLTFENSDINGGLNNIITTSNMETCKQECNSTQECGGFTYDSSNVCTIKSGCLSKSSIIPTDPAKNQTLQIRTKSLPKTKIKQQSVSLDTYNSFAPFEAITLTSNMQFIQMKDTEPTPINKSDLSSETTINEITKNITNIESNNNQINLFTNKNKSNIIESMMNIDTANEMLNDGDLINLQSKYINICWSILAIGTVIFTITNLKK